MADIDRGFEIHDRVLAPAEIASLFETLSSARRSKAGARHLMSNPTVQQIASDRRLLAIASCSVGPAPFPFRATLFDKSADANWLVAWHQDTALPLHRRIESAGWGPWSVKQGVLYAHAPASALTKIVALRVHLDDSTGANGPLRVLPGTHRSGVLSDAAIAQLAREVAPAECVAEAGAVVAMRPLLVHASSKSRTGARRRVLHIEYAEGPSVAPQVELAIA